MLGRLLDGQQHLVNYNLYSHLVLPQHILPSTNPPTHTPWLPPSSPLIVCSTRTSSSPVLAVGSGQRPVSVWFDRLSFVRGLESSRVLSVLHILVDGFGIVNGRAPLLLLALGFLLPTFFLFVINSPFPANYKRSSLFPTHPRSPFICLCLFSMRYAHTYTFSLSFFTHPNTPSDQL